jgi:cystathionine beta-lyase family protein involved in aluminum resistance
VDVSALCDTQNKAQVTKANGSVEVEFLVDSVVGPIFANKEGYYCQIVLTAGSLTARTFVGVVTATGQNVANEEALTESATITLGANGVTTAWT